MKNAIVLVNHKLMSDVLNILSKRFNGNTSFILHAPNTRENGIHIRYSTVNRSVNVPIIHLGDHGDYLIKAPKHIYVTNGYVVDPYSRIIIYNRRSHIPDIKMFVSMKLVTDAPAIYMFAHNIDKYRNIDSVKVLNYFCAYKFIKSEAFC